MAFSENDWLKLGFMVLVLFEAIIMGLLPVKCKSFKENPIVMGAANSFSGGVFLAICTMHIMPEQTESWVEYKIVNNIEMNLPLPFGLLVCGYSLILVLDRVLFDAHDDEHAECQYHTDLNPSLIESKANEIRKSMADNHGFNTED